MVAEAKPQGVSREIRSERHRSLFSTPVCMRVESSVKHQPVLYLSFSHIVTMFNTFVFAYFFPILEWCAVTVEKFDFFSADFVWWLNIVRYWLHGTYTVLGPLYTIHASSSLVHLRKTENASKKWTDCTAFFICYTIASPPPPPMKLLVWSTVSFTFSAEVSS